ncbi:MAG: hypothetical protein ABR505_09880 [Actinomycetota bacterium]
MTFSATVGVHASAGIKVRRAGQTGRPAIEIKTGDDLHRDSGEWRQREMRVDREANRYTEKVTDRQGKVVRDVDEPLSVHRGRGSAKFKKKRTG